MNRVSGVFWVVLFGCAFWRGALAAQAVGALTSSSSVDSIAPAADLYTIELIGTPDLRRFTGTAAMVPPASPFTAPVTAAGEHRWQLRVRVDSLPDPRSLGGFSTFVVWAAPPSLRPMIRLGALRWTGANDPVDVELPGVVALNRFTVFVTAEPSADVREPGDSYVLRGLSPSMRLGEAHIVQASAAAPVHEHHSAGGWTMPAPHPRASTMYMPGLAGMLPHATPYLPGAAVDPGTVPAARPRALLEPEDGDTIRLEAGLVRRTLRGRELLMYAFNGQHPGPLVHVRQGIAVHVNFVNRTELPTAVHWHGIRLDNRFDGVPHVTQEPVAPGDSFHYVVRFPDAGVYWYHPHHREDIQQDLGLSGNLLVRSARADAYSPVHEEQVVMLDDLLLGEPGLVPYGAERATHALMGRFGNVLLVNGEPAPSYTLEVRRGSVVRFFFTNVANTRTFNVSFPGARMKVVGSDIGRYEQEAWVESVVIAPAERYIVDVAFDSAGTTPVLNRVQAIDHTFGVFFPEEDTLGFVKVTGEPATPDYAHTFDRLRRHDDVVQDVARYREHFTRAPDLTLTLTMNDNGLPFPLVALMRLDTLFFNPVEWSGTMPMMDWLPTTDQVTWTLRDEASGLENEEITWQFRIGDLVRVRLVNDRHTLHAMAHPIHIHGQRFLVLDVSGRPTRNHVWKDTVLVPVGGVVELLLEITNPGMWMIHCHIAEHLEAGMKTVFAVQ